MRRTFALTLLVLAVVLASCRQDPVTPPTPDTPDTTTVTEVLTENGFTTLASAITAAGLNETLAGDGPFTLFAPTDEAFEALPDGVLDALLANPEALAEVLEYHVLPVEANAAALTPSFRTTVQGSPLAVTVGTANDTQAVALNGVATITDPDLEADNGVVHGIDAVLTLPETEFAASLAGANEVPPVESAATGSLTATLDGTTLTIEGTYEGLTIIDDPGAHIHGPATATENAGVLLPLTFDNEAGTLSATVDLAALEDPDLSAGPALFGWLQNGLLYANLHTAENPNGEIRGQLLPAEAPPPTNANFTASLRGSEEVPPVETDASGTASAVLDEAGTTLTVTGSYTGLSSALAPVGGSAGHIHEAPRGENGPVVVPLTLTPDEADPASGTFSGTAPIGEGEGQLALETLEANGYYINIHTENNPAGEIRGQITPVPEEAPPAPAPTSR